MLLIDKAGAYNFNTRGKLKNYTHSREITKLFSFFRKKYAHRCDCKSQIIVKN